MNISWIFSMTRLAILTTSLLTSVSFLQASDSPQIGVDSNANRVVIWETYNTITSVYEIRSAKYVALTSTWSTFSNPISTSSNSQSPIILVHGNGNAIAIWNGVHPVSENSAVQAVMYDGSNSTWGNVITLSPSNENASSDYQGALDGNGVASVVWSSFNETDQVIRVATLDLSETVATTQLYP